MNEPWWIDAIKAVVIINLVLGVFAYMTWVERKVIGRMQLRYGPNRAGPFGLLQPIADLVKLIRKEAFYPSSAVGSLYYAAPVISAFTALAGFAVIPWGPGWHIGGYDISGQIVNVPIGLILLFALGSLGVYGFIIGGWASDSKYSLLGSMRTCAQLVSYEVSLALSVLGVIIMAGSLSLVDIVHSQQADWWYAVPQFVGLLVFFVAGVAETNRAPFDLPEAEQELVAGYHTEYSGMRFGLFQMAEYINLIVLSGLAVTLFFGGWLGPVDSLGPIWFVLKVARRPVHLHLDADDPAAPALRPADGLRLEDPAPGGDAERARHRGDRGGRYEPAAVRLASRASGSPPKHIFKKPITQQYPEYKRPVYPRFRGRHRLWRHENGLEKCVGCSLCAAACPADCIRVVAEENTANNRVSAGERYARIYEINLSRCIFCGYCELACPFDAITLEAEYEISEYSRDDLIYTKDMLLAPPVKRMPVADRQLYDTPIPAYKARS